MTTSLLFKRFVFEIYYFYQDIPTDMHSMEKWVAGVTGGIYIEANAIVGSESAFLKNVKK